jgi:hypothetical protein
MQSTHYSSQILMKHDFFQQILEKTRKGNLVEIRPVGAELFHADGRTDRHNEANRRVLCFKNRAFLNEIV